ncbi:hypothetical protein [Bacillus sp. AK128]
MRNEKGSSLLLVLLVSLVFMVLGLSIISASIGGSKRTEFRNAEIISTQDAINTIEQVTAEFRVEMQNRSKYPLDESDMMDFNEKLQIFTQSIVDKYSTPQIQITDLTLAGNSYDYIDTDHYFTRVLELSVDLDGKRVHQNIILSPTPSFLEYAVGSIGMEENQGLYLNGSPFIYGNVFANDIYLQDQANYIDSISAKTANTKFPAIEGNLYVQNRWNALNYEDYSDEELRKLFYLETIPTIKTDKKDFIDINFRKSFAEKINDLISDPTRPVTEESIPAINEPNRDQQIETIIANYVEDSNFLATTQDELRLKFLPEPEYVLYSKSNGQKTTLTLTTDLLIPKHTWLIVHGDLTIFPFDTAGNPLEVNGNILVTGDVIIAGNEEPVNEGENDVVSFDSTIYSLGEATILNTNIEGINDKQLVLMSLGKLTITRINEFTDYEGHVQNLNDVTNISPLKAFFYTDDEAELYGVGSLFYIHGGIFAKDQLVINATRGNTIQNADKTITVTELEQLDKPSRFNVIYDKDVILDQLDALPRVERLQVVPDNLYID